MSFKGKGSRDLRKRAAVVRRGVTFNDCRAFQEPGRAEEVGKLYSKPPAKPIRSWKPWVVLPAADEVYSPRDCLEG